MNYASMTFLYFFLPVFFGLYALARPRFRALVMALGSCAVIALADPYGLIPMGICFLTAYLCGLGCGKAKETSKGLAGLLLAVCIITEITSAVLFCTVHILSESITAVMGAGIYTLGSVYYCFGVFKGEFDAEKNPVRLLAYICFIPSLCGIPLADPAKILPGLKEPKLDVTKIADGIILILLGIVEKAVISDRLSLLFDEMLSNSSGNLSMLMSWFGAFIFAFALFCRLRGYARIAVGFALMMGFELPASFDHPYSKATLRDYLSSFNTSAYAFVQKHIYSPIAGDEGRQLRTLSATALSIVIVCISYHPSVSFLIWGVSAALLIIVEMLMDHVLSRIPTPIRYIITHMMTLIGWAFVSQGTVVASLEYVSHMFSLTIILDSTPLLYFFRSALPSVLLLTLIELPVTERLITRFKDRSSTSMIIIKPVLTFALLILCTVFLISDNGTGSLLQNGGII